MKNVVGMMLALSMAVASVNAEVDPSIASEAKTRKAGAASKKVAAITAGLAVLGLAGTGAGLQHYGKIDMRKWPLINRAFDKAAKEVAKPATKADVVAAEKAAQKAAADLEEANVALRTAKGLVTRATNAGADDAVKVAAEARRATAEAAHVEKVAAAKAAAEELATAKASFAKATAEADKVAADKVAADKAKAKA